MNLTRHSDRTVQHDQSPASASPDDVSGAGVIFPADVLPGAQQFPGADKLADAPDLPDADHREHRESLSPVPDLSAGQAQGQAQGHAAHRQVARRPSSPGRLLSASFSSALLLPALILIVLLLFFFLLGIGPSAIDPLTLFADWRRGSDTLATLIFVEIRLPRALLALSVGAVLGMSGAAMQGLLRNPLAEPGLLGVSGSAALGAVLALYYGLGTVSWLMLPLFGMLGAGASVLLILLLAGRHASVSALLLAGVAVSAMSSSGIALALNFAPNPFAMSEMVYWLLGSFANRTLQEFLLTLPFMLAGLLLLWSRARFLSALTLGEETAQSLGFEVTRERLLVIFATALAVGAAVAVSGAIGFVGLVVPHLMRPLVGHEPGRLLPVSALAGAALMLLADISVQLLSPQQELKVGVITALVGGPFFLALILRLRRRLP